MIFHIHLYHNLKHRVPVLWELHKAHYSAEVAVGTKDRTHPIDDVMNRVWDGLINKPIHGFGYFLHLTLSRLPFWASIFMRSKILL